MAIQIEQFSGGKDLYWLYEYEDSVLRWESATKKVYRKFKGEVESELASHTDFFRHSLSTGELISQAEYETY